LIRNRSQSCGAHVPDDAAQREPAEAADAQRAAHHVATDHARHQQDHLEPGQGADGGRRVDARFAELLAHARLLLAGGGHEGLGDGAADRLEGRGDALAAGDAGLRRLRFAGRRVLRQPFLQLGVGPAAHQQAGQEEHRHGDGAEDADQE
jgi:hypothetical protein